MKRFIVLLTVTAMVLSSVIGFSSANDTVLYGDCNGDGSINLADVTLMLKYIAGWNVPVDFAAADLNVDDSITLSDVTILLKYIAGWHVIMGVPYQTFEDGEYTFVKPNFSSKEELRILYYGKTATDYLDEYIYAESSSSSYCSLFKVITGKINGVYYSDEKPNKGVFSRFFK